ncbi:MAG TPA: type III pantothenate kinase [Cyclobacteriaceae bacterium]|nr:type III pantothenate kinase [Cyclobacteriaceae bacterium]
MLLAIDIGNSDITLGLSSQNRWTHLWRIPSALSRPELFYGIKLREYFFESGLRTESVDQIVMSSVVPGLTDRIVSVVMTMFEKKPIVLGPDVYEKLPIEVLNPYEIGSDLVSNALAAYVLFKQNCIVVDFGTALTFTTISDKGKILGVAIAPGLKTAIKSLSQNTAKLFDVPLDLPKSALGKNTVHAIQAGILLGYEGLVSSMLNRIKNELADMDCSTIATGGLSSIISPLKDHFTVVDENLTLNGLKLVGDFVKQ